MRRALAALVLVAIIASPAFAHTFRVRIGKSTKTWDISADEPGPIVVTITGNSRFKEINPVVAIVDQGGDTWCKGAGAESIVRCEFYAREGDRYTIGVRSDGAPVSAVINIRGPLNERPVRLTPSETTTFLEAALDSLVR